MLDRFERKCGGSEAGPSRPRRRRSLSSDRLGNLEFNRLDALREENFILQDSLEQPMAEVRTMKAEVRDLRAKAHHSNQEVERLTSELRESRRRERLIEEIRTMSHEESFRNGVSEYRYRMTQEFPEIDLCRLPYYVGPDGVPRF